MKPVTQKAASGEGSGLAATPPCARESHAAVIVSSDRLNPPDAPFKKEASTRALRKVRGYRRRFPCIEIVAQQIELLARQVERGLAK